MSLESYEGLEVASRLLQRLAKALKTDGTISKPEILQIITETIVDLGGEILDNESKQ